MQAPVRIAVIGAGIVGTSTALALRKRGADVTLIDRGEPGSGCSAGNSGAVSPASVAPLAMPGVLASLPSMLLDDESRSDTYPPIRIGEDDVDVGHEATVSKVGDEQLFYLMSHGISEEEAGKLIVNGFIEPIVKELPMEYAVEMNRLIELQMEGSIG